MHPPGVDTLVANLVALEVAERARVALEAAGIPTLFLKGSAYLETLYPDLASRPMSDVDVLIPVDDRVRGKQVLIDAGFTCSPAVARRVVSYAHHYNWPFVYPGPIPIVVEVHVELSQPGRYPIDYPGIWSRRVVRSAASRTVPTMATEDALLHVVVHDTKSWYSTPAHQRSEDVRRIVEQWRPDWATFVERAKAWGLAAAAHVTLQIAHASGVAIPEWVLAALAPPRLRAALLHALVDFERGVPRLDVSGRGQQLAITIATDSGWQLVRFLSNYLGKRVRDVLHG